MHDQLRFHRMIRDLTERGLLESSPTGPRVTAAGETFTEQLMDELAEKMPPADPAKPRIKWSRKRSRDMKKAAAA